MRKEFVHLYDECKKEKRGDKTMIRSNRVSHQDLNYVYKGSCYQGLPLELKEYYYYYNDGKTGHVIMAIPSSLLHNAEETQNYYQYEYPFPVRYVLAHGYQLLNGFLVCEGEYDRNKGVLIPKQWFEV